MNEPIEERLSDEEIAERVAMHDEYYADHPDEPGFGPNGESWNEIRAIYETVPDDEDDDEEEWCLICGGPMEWVNCYNCFGEGEFDLYDMNPNEYEPGDIDRCEICQGKGGYLECIHLPHKEKENQAR